MNQQDVRRMSVHDAARLLGISEDAVRMRVKRGKLDSEREGGRLWVYLTGEPTVDRTDELIGTLRDQVRDLREQLEQANERDRENRRIIAALTSRIPAIEAPSDRSEAAESPESGADLPMGPVPAESSEAAQEPTERVSWWRRVFGG